MIKGRVKEAINAFVQILRYGNADVITATHVLPHGIDSKPNKEDIAVTSETSSNEDSGVVIGYLKKFTGTNEGETRIYATDTNGVEVGQVYLTNAGDVEINGNVDNMVRYSLLDAGLQSQDTLINAELAKIAVAINAIVPGSYTPGTVSTDIDASKIDDVLTN